MNNFKIEHIISELVKHFIVAGHRNNSLTINGLPCREYNGLRDGLYAMQFAISFQMDNYGYEKDGNTHHPEWERRFKRTIHVLVTQRHNVFVAVTGQLKSEDYEWYNTSNHDSCWSTDGLDIFDHIFYEGYEHCFGFVPEEHKKLPVEVNPFVQFNDWHFGNSPFKIVKVKGEYNVNKDYRWNVTEIKPIEFTLNIIDESLT